MASPEASAAAPGVVAITLVYSPAARQVVAFQVTVPAGSSAALAVAQSGLLAQYPALSQQPLNLGIWGRSCTSEQILQDGDRLALYRALRVDPKVARRERFRRQGTKGTGLFATRRAGGKAGY